MKQGLASRYGTNRLYAVESEESISRKVAKNAIRA